MATFVEYQLADGAKLLVEAEEPQEPGLVRVSRDPLGNAVASAFEQRARFFAGLFLASIGRNLQLDLAYRRRLIEDAAVGLGG